MTFSLLFNFVTPNVNFEKLSTLRKKEENFLF